MKISNAFDQTSKIDRTECMGMRGATFQDGILTGYIAPATLNKYIFSTDIA